MDTSLLLESEVSREGVGRPVGSRPWSSDSETLLAPSPSVSSSMAQGSRGLSQ